MQIRNFEHIMRFLIRKFLNFDFMKNKKRALNQKFNQK